MSLCGEMAADPAVLPLLVGLGLDDFSMSPAAIPVARGVVERLDTRRARRLAARVMRMSTAAEVERCLLRDLEPGAARGTSAGREPGKGGRSGTR